MYNNEVVINLIIICSNSLLTFLLQVFNSGLDLQRVNIFHTVTCSLRNYRDNE